MATRHNVFRRLPLSESQANADNLSEQDYSMMLDPNTIYVVGITIDDEISTEDAQFMMDRNIKGVLDTYEIFRILYFNQFNIRGAESTLSEWYYNHGYTVKIMKYDTGSREMDDSTTIAKRLAAFASTPRSYFRVYTSADNPAINDAITDLLADQED